MGGVFKDKENLLLFTDSIILVQVKVKVNLVLPRENRYIYIYITKLGWMDRLII